MGILHAKEGTNCSDVASVGGGVYPAIIRGVRRPVKTACACGSDDDVDATSDAHTMSMESTD